VQSEDVFTGQSGTWAKDQGMGIATVIFVVLVVGVLIVVDSAARLKGHDLSKLHEWGLGGRQFGVVMSWFLVGGDVYTAYTFIAVPALMFGAGALAYFAVSYTLMSNIVLFAIFPKLWRVSAKYGYVTGAEFVRARYGNRLLALAIGVTGILSTVPYIALQLVGMQTVIGALGFTGTGLGAHLPLIMAVMLVALFTVTSGLRAVAMVSVVKNLLIFLTVIVGFIVIPAELGGFGAIFGSVLTDHLLLAHPPAGSSGLYSGYATLALGSAMALFLYPHAMTGILASRSRQVVRRTAFLLPVFSFMLGLVALFGVMAVAAGVSHMPQYADGFRNYGPNFSFPALLLHAMPAWFVGIAFAAIAIGALVPAAIMGIAAANIFTRDMWRQFIAPSMSSGTEALIAKLFAIAIILGGLVFEIDLPLKYAIQLQLLGGMWIIQTFPAVVFSLFTRFYNGWALLIGWVAGFGMATNLALLNHLSGAIYTFDLFGYTVPCYIAVVTFCVNVVVATALSPLFHRIASDRNRDMTVASDYL
jgi:SSS family solute:Na+ symporter